MPLDLKKVGAKIKSSVSDAKERAKAVASRPEVDTLRDSMKRRQERALAKSEAVARDPREVNAANSLADLIKVRGG